VAHGLEKQFIKLKQMLFVAANFLNAQQGVLAPVLGTLDVSSEMEYSVWLEPFFFFSRKKIPLF